MPPDIQHKAAFVASEFGFTDDGGRVPIQPPEFQEDNQTAILLDRITMAPDRQTALQILEDALFDSRQDGGITLASECLREIIFRLGDSAPGVALRHALLGDDEPLRTSAQRAKVSHVSIIRAIEKIKNRLGITGG